MKVPKSTLSLSGILIVLWLTATAGAYYVRHKPFDAPAALAALTLLWRLGAAFAVVVVAGAIGRRLAGDVRLRPAARLAYHAAIGLGLLSLLQLLAGVTAGLSTAGAWALLALLGVIHRASVRGWLADLSDVGAVYLAGGRLGRWLAGFSAIGIGVGFLAAAAPPVKFDALVYHLALPQAYVEAGRIVFPTGNAFAGMPQLGEMLYTLALELTGAWETAALLGWLAGLLALTGLLGYVTQRIGARAAWVAVAVLLSGETILQSLGWAYVDWFALLFGWALLVALDQRPLPAALAGLFAGFALGTKYTAGAGLIAGLAVILLGRNPYASPTVYRRRFREMAVFVLAAGLAFLPWAVRNLIATGNPIYPFFFPAGEMTPERLALYAGQPAWGGIENALLLLWQAAMTGLEGAPGFAASIGFLMLALGVLAGLGLAGRPENQQLAIRQAAVFAVSGLAVWAIAGRLSGLLIQSRLYFVLFPAFAFLAAAGFDGLARFRWPGVRLGRIAAILVLGALGMSLFAAARGALAAGAPQTALGLQSQADYRLRSLGMVELAMQAISDLPASARVLLLFEPRGLACTPRCDPDEFLDRWTTDAAAAGHDPEAVLDAWRASGFTHVLYHRSGADFFRGDSRFPLQDWLVLNAVVTSLDPVADLDGVYLLFALP